MSGQVINIPAAGGGSGSPGGPNTSVQFNSGGSFGGFGTWDGTYLTVPGSVQAAALGNGGSNSIDLVNLTLGGGGLVALDYQNRQEYDNVSVLAHDWEGRVLYDASPTVSVRYADRTLLAASGFTSLNWEVWHLQDSGGTVTADWNAALLYGAGGVATLDWKNCQANSQAGDLAIDWDGHRLIKSSTVFMTWNGGIGFFGASAVSQQASSGPQSATAIYGSTEQTMLQQAYDALRAYGLMT